MTALETVAIYREERIKTYGFDIFEGLALLEIAAGSGTRGDVAEAGEGLETEDGKYKMVHGWNHPQDGPVLTLVLETGTAGTLAETTRSRGLSVRLESPVDMIHFQGPHYGDRFGVSHAVLEGLARGGIPWLRLVCAGSSVHIVLPGGRAAAAKKVLEGVFEAPESGYAG